MCRSPSASVTSGNVFSPCLACDRGQVVLKPLPTGQSGRYPSIDVRVSMRSFICSERAFIFIGVFCCALPLIHCGGDLAHVVDCVTDLSGPVGSNPRREISPNAVIKPPVYFEFLTPPQSSDLVFDLFDAHDGFFYLCGLRRRSLRPIGLCRPRNSFGYTLHSRLWVICPTSSTFRAFSEASPTTHLLCLAETSRSAV
jgi:hypothetical protein